MNRAWRGTGRICAIAVLVLLHAVAGGNVRAAEQDQPGLKELISLVDSSAPVVVKARRDWQAAVSSLASAQADLGWQLSVSTTRQATLEKEPQNSLDADLRLGVSLSRVMASGQKLVLAADQMVLGLSDGNSANDPGEVNLGWSWRWPGGIDLTQNETVKEKQRAVEQKAAALELAYESAVDTVAKSYNDYWKARLDEQVAQKQVTAYSKALEKSQALVQVGRATALDVTIAEQQVKVAQANLRACATQVEVALRDLSRQLGVEQSALPVGKWQAPAWSPGPVEEPTYWVSKAPLRPEVRQAEISVEAALAAVAKAQVSWAYDIKPVISYDIADKQAAIGVDITKVEDIGGNVLTASFRLKAGGGWSAAASFTASMGGSSAYAKVNKTLEIKNAEDDLADARIALTQAREDAAEAMQDLWDELQAKTLQRDLQLALLSRERINMDTVNARAALGTVTEFDVLDAELALLQAEVAAQKALFDQQLVYIKLLAAAGDKEGLTRREE